MKEKIKISPVVFQIVKEIAEKEEIIKKEFERKRKIKEEREKKKNLMAVGITVVVLVIWLIIFYFTFYKNWLFFIIEKSLFFSWVLVFILFLPFLLLAKKR